MLNFQRSLPMMLNYTLDAVMPVHRELFARFDLTEQQWRVLRMLWTSEKTTAVEISKQTLLPAPSLVGILDRLEKKGLVERKRSESDRRKTYVLVTEQGRALQQQVLPLVQDIQIHLTQSIGTDDWAALERILDTIKQNMDDVTLADILRSKSKS
ncbi:homoprotocatechuate degradation operon regulator, HpaR [Amylibacter ulvae]|uniref:Homoprotocatechuate degradation operon regulator, HpaR n=2 Tax=Paramylibacter ulvae TaxID=1651968 RepID=A0ABQ3CV74_9RHOB|nr:homoprotocatechuate degradation operon regulator, HpaR [Amylibacter ulvae]